MRFKLGLMIGLAVGYYFGAKAGRTRYEQLRVWLERAKDSDLLETAADKAKAVVDLGVERARDLVDRGQDDPVVIDLAVEGRGYSPSR
jgi:divalent metal cation (Fe/Co/Zn/Cd) transporter